MFVSMVYTLTIIEFAAILFIGVLVLANENKERRQANGHIIQRKLAESEYMAERILSNNLKRENDALTEQLQASKKELAKWKRNQDKRTGKFVAV